jgi:beta-lactamase regulating signal transducer with metallopeptidase domain
MMAALINHLWQSTAFALAVALLTVLFRSNRAQIRFGLWLSASIKFLVPFALLMSLGSQVGSAPVARKIAAPSISSAIVEFSQPFPSMPSTPGASDWAVIAIFGIWACGFAGVALLRLRGWLSIRAALRASTPLDIPSSVEVRSAPGLLEPGAVGLFRPILLLPSDIRERLTPLQLEAVLAHEVCHVQRRDNLTAAIHMIVEALFWFHPFVWWIGARLMAERERASDEAVLQLGNAPHEYAEGILNICKSYVESPLRCVTGATGSDLRKRIQAILGGRVARNLNFSKKAALAVAGIIAVAAPVLVGILNAPFIRAQSKPPVGSVKRTAAATGPEHTEACVSALGSVTANTVTVKPQVQGQVITLTFKEGGLVQAGEVLGTIDPRPFQIQLDQAEAQFARDEAKLADAQNAVPKQPAVMAEVEASLKADRASIENAELQLSYTKLTAPIAGIAGLRLGADGPVVLIQQKPVAVVFTLSEDCLPQVLPRRNDANVPVEAWNRDNTRSSRRAGSPRLTTRLTRPPGPSSSKPCSTTRVENCSPTNS